MLEVLITWDSEAEDLFYGASPDFEPSHLTKPRQSWTVDFQLPQPLFYSTVMQFTLRSIYNALNIHQWNNETEQLFSNNRSKNIGEKIFQYSFETFTAR